MKVGRSYQPLTTYPFWAASSITASLLVVKFAPQFSVRHSYFWTAVAIFGAQSLIYFIYAVVIYPRFLSPLRHLPEPQTGNSFFNGQFWTMINEPSGIPARRWVNEIPNDGLIRYRHLWNRERLLLTSPKALAEVLTAKSYDFVKPDLLRIGIGQLLGIGILFAEGDEHKMQRKNFMPAFNFGHIKELYPIFWSKSQLMVQCLREELDKVSPSTTVEVGEWASRATLDIIGAAGMGQEFNTLENPDNDLNRVYRNIFQASQSARVLAVLQFFVPPILLRNLPLKRNDDVHEAVRIVRETSRQLIQHKQDQMAQKEKLSPDIISVALESGGFSHDQLVDNMMIFLAAGHETTATAFTWAVYLLAQHQDVQARLRDEVHAHIPSLSFDGVTHDLIDNHMPYLHAVCNEVLRVYAPVPLTLRDTAVDTSIQGQFVPRGTKIILAPWAINHSTALWGPDAAAFNPDRWLAPGQANAGGATSNYAFLTFLHGPRSCIGAKFAVAELACLLAAFVASFDFALTDPDEKIDIRGGVTAKPKNGMKVNLKIVEGW